LQSINIFLEPSVHSITTKGSNYGSYKNTSNCHRYYFLLRHGSGNGCDKRISLIAPKQTNNESFLDSLTYPCGTRSARECSALNPLEIQMKLTTEQKQVLQEASAIYESLASQSKINFSSPEDVADFLKPRLSAEEREHFEVLFLSQQHKLIKAERLFSGTINQASVYPREIAKLALELNSAAVILAHNHPSGETSPSQSDKELTKQIKESLELFEIRTLDHLIIGFSGNNFSFAENGML